MAYLDNKSQKEYYQGSNYGSYQFCTLQDIINQFMAVYVGEDKIIPRAKRVDVAFHAQRALAELSFDTFKSFKSQQIEVPNSLTMILPHDYVNYTKVSWVDGGGIKHRLYPTKDTSNPFQIRQDSSGNYDFPEGIELVVNNDFSETLQTPWFFNPFSGPASTGLGSDVTIVGGVLTFGHSSHGDFGQAHGKALSAWQAIDVSSIDYLNIKATATTDASTTTTVGADTYSLPATTVRFGLSTIPGSDNIHNLQNTYNPVRSPNASTDIFDIDYLEWTAGETGEKEKLSIDVSSYDTIYVLITSIAPFTNHTVTAPQQLETLFVDTTIDDLSVKNAYSANELQPAAGKAVNSSTWDSYKALTPTENQNSTYEDDVFWPYSGERHGLDPAHAQINGSFYIDELRGKIHFSSNVASKNIILDYISDSLGTEDEMQVHKLAEDAMYKHILCDIMSGRANIGAGRLQYYKKDKFAAVRKAKLRLSNFKLEELTQVLRGKSKWIKH